MNQLNHSLSQRIVTLRWIVPCFIGILTVLYEIGPGRWIHDSSVAAYFDLDIAFYGLVMPLIAYATLMLLGRWLDEKERAARQARTSEQRLASIITASADAILGLDPDGCIESWNRGAELIFGYKASEVRGWPFTRLFGGSEAAEVELNWLTQQVRATGFLRGHETTLRKISGREIIIELTATHLVDEAGKSLGMSVILRDVTERKHRDAEIRRLNASLNEQVIERTAELAEKVELLARANADLQNLDKMRSEFVSLVSHQIRAPLTNMRGAIERMHQDCSLANRSCGPMLVILDQQVGRLDRLVTSTLSAARIEAGNLVLDPEPISLMPVVNQIVEQTRARSKHRSFQILNKPGLPLVFADRDRVAEVLANLLDNADKYSPPSQVVVIDVHADQVEVAVSICDSGRGIPPADLDRVFEKFYRADSSDAQPVYGYGLGLYVCKQLVQAQGGRIWAENAPGGGAVFTFTLPIVR